MDAHEIFENFHGSGAKGTGALEGAQHTSYQLASSFQDDAVAIQKLIDGIGSGWTGRASDAASYGLAPMAENLLATGQDLNTHQDLVFRQVQSYQRAASQVQPVPPAPTMTDIVGLSLAGLATGGAAVLSQAPSMYNQVAQHNAVSQANVDAYNGYVQASKYNSDNLPPLSGTMNTDNPVPVAVRNSPPAIGGPVVSGRSTAPRSTTGPSAPHIDSGTHVSPSPAASRPTPGNAVAPSGNPAPGTTAASAAPTPVAPTDASVPVASTGTGGNTEPPVSAFATGDIGSRLAGGDNTPGVDGVARPLGGGRAGSATDGGDVRGGRSGASPVANEGGDRTVPGSPVDDIMAGERDAMGAGPIGAGRGTADDDADHERKVPLSADPDVFDGTEPVGAQVLGETDEQYQARIARDSGQHR